MLQAPPFYEAAALRYYSRALYIRYSLSPTLLASLGTSIRGWKDSGALSQAASS